MANTLTNLIPEIYESLDVVSRELVGMIPAVTMDAAAERAAKDATIRTFVAPAAAAGDIAPAATTPDDGNQTIGSVTLAITKARRVPIRWNGEEESFGCWFVWRCKHPCGSDSTGHSYPGQ